MSAPSGGLVVDKPAGVTSHDVVARARRVLRTRAVGHAGTLDPMATGALVLGVGEGTKLCGLLSGDDKAYVGRVRFGVATSSDDAEGEVTARAPAPEALLEALGRAARGEVGEPLRAALDAERARALQVPPRVSALHVDGERAHVRARRGEALELPPRPVRLLSVEVLSASVDPPTLTLSVEVGKGYYVRALARDLGERLGVPAHLEALRRTRAGAFRVEDAVPLDRLGEGLQPLVAFAARALPVVELDEEETRRFRAGRWLERAEPPPSPFLARSPEGHAVALGRVDEERRLVVLRGLNDP